MLLTPKKLDGWAVPLQHANLLAELETLSGIMMRWTLMYHGLKLPSSLGVSDIAKAVIHHLEHGDLTDSQVREMRLDLLEYGGKRVFLYEADPEALAAWHPPVPDAVVSSRAEGRILPSSGTERLCYILADDDSIRIVHTEQHENVMYDYLQTPVIPEKVPIQRVIVLEANRTTGAVALLIDSPGQIHTHQKKLAYYRYWQQRAQALLGVPLMQQSLFGVLKRLQDDHRVVIASTRIRTAEGIIDMTGTTTEDVRQMPQYDANNATRIAYDRDEYIWLPQPAVAPSATGIPLRRVKVFMTASAGEIRFTHHALRSEVDYVLGQLRENA